MLTLSAEYKQWLENYEILKDQMRAAYRFKNANKALELRARMTTTIDMIRRLEKEGNTYSGHAVSAPVTGNVKVAKHSPMYLKSINTGSAE